MTIDGPRSPTAVDRIIGQRTKLGRLLRGISQEQFAEQLGVSVQQLQKYEDGSNRVAASRLYAVAQTLELPLAYFFGDKDIVPKDLAASIDDDSVDVLRKFHQLSKNGRKVVRQVMAQLTKAA